MFNLQGSEIIIILLLALVVLGPEKLPDAMRRAGKMYADLKKMATGFQDEFRSAMDEPMREMQETANLLRDSADFTNLSTGERSEKPQSASMGDASSLAPADPSQIPVDELPFGPSADPERPDGTAEFDELPEPGHDLSTDPGTDANARSEGSVPETSSPADTRSDEPVPDADPNDDERRP